MKEDLNRIMIIIKDYKTGYGGVTESFIRKELETFAKDYHIEQCNTTYVVGQSEHSEKIDNAISLLNEVATDLICHCSIPKAAIPISQNKCEK